MCIQYTISVDTFGNLCKDSKEVFVITLTGGGTVQINIRKLVPFLGLVLVFAAYCPAIAMEDEDCMECHGDVDMVGDDLFIDGVKFNTTMHAEEGCIACHDVSDEHPDDGLETSIAASCADCHDDVDGEYAPTTHAENASCGDCHNPHYVRSATAVYGRDMDLACGECHDNAEMLETHSAWLSQADLHFEAVSCVTCHTESEDYAVSLYMVERESGDPYGDFKLVSYEKLKEMAGDKEIQNLIDSNGDDVVSEDELRAFHKRSAYKQRHNKAMRLKEMMTPEAVTHDFKIFDNRRDCSFCHAAGTDKMQTSYVAIPNEDGSYRRIAVEEGALHDPLKATPDFYVPGSTRHWVLDILGLVIILGGCAMPVGHGFFRILTMKNRRGKGH
jgi:hypothetical protein